MEPPRLWASEPLPAQPRNPKISSELESSPIWGRFLQVWALGLTVNTGMGPTGMHKFEINFDSYQPVILCLSVCLLCFYSAYLIHVDTPFVDESASLLTYQYIYIYIHIYIYTFFDYFRLFALLCSFCCIPVYLAGRRQSCNSLCVCHLFLETSIMSS